MSRRAAIALVLVNVACGLYLHRILTQQPASPFQGCFAVDYRLPGVVYPLGYLLHCDPNRPVWDDLVPYRATTAPPVTR